MEVIIVVVVAVSALAVAVVLALGVTVRRSPAMDREAELAALEQRLEQGDGEAPRSRPA